MLRRQAPVPRRRMPSFPAPCIILAVPRLRSSLVDSAIGKPQPLCWCCLQACSSRTSRCSAFPTSGTKPATTFPPLAISFSPASLIPTSTLSNAHPPLLMAYLAAAWKMFGYSPLVTRSRHPAGGGVHSVWRLPPRRARSLTARSPSRPSSAPRCYPVFFSQSAMAHLDLAAAGLILWGLWFYLARSPQSPPSSSSPSPAWPKKPPRWSRWRCCCGKQHFPRSAIGNRQSAMRFRRHQIAMPAARPRSALRLVCLPLRAHRTRLRQPEVLPLQPRRHAEPGALPGRVWCCGSGTCSAT